MVADAEFILTTIVRGRGDNPHRTEAEAAAQWGIGADRFDVDAVRAARVPVLILATYRRLMLADRKLREGVWPRPQLRAQC